jgi:hypothetical protein
MDDEKSHRYTDFIHSTVLGIPSSRITRGL